MDQPLHRSPRTERARRLGIADIAAAYGTEALQRRIAQLHEAGQHYAALAIEREIRSATVAEAG
ncbi:hypothetical protein [Nocardia higoensis]|uniref:hypothetical protein n=1 Tax=Nocardia higoensis TaxID=228599 RepID=UPI0002F937DE|nr:hypothetical protein [Nocardia higoensis]